MYRVQLGFFDKLKCSNASSHMRQQTAQSAVIEPTAYVTSK